MKQFLIGLLVVGSAAVASAQFSFRPVFVWVTTIHRGENVTMGRTYIDRARALRDAKQVTDPDVWVIVQPSELVIGGVR